jgi:hypothetical protein
MAEQTPPYFGRHNDVTGINVSSGFPKHELPEFDRLDPNKLFARAFDHGSEARFTEVQVWVIENY